MSNVFDTEGPPEKQGVMSNPFWIAIVVVWILMVVVGLTLAIALGIWTLIGAF